MAINILSTAHSSKQEEEEEEEEYIDLEVSSYSIFHSTSFTSPPTPQHPNTSNREFEFHMSSDSVEREQPSTSPADELFYKGKLLPLHLPPRLQMVEKLLENSNKPSRTACEEFYSTPLTTSPSTPIRVYSTPFESCNVSPSESCAVSRELNPKEYFFECQLEDEIRSGNPKKSLARKIKLIKQSLLGSKLKTPKTYLKSLFGKYSCSHESCASNIHQASAMVAKDTESTNTNGNFIKRDRNLSSSADVMRSFHKESEADKSQCQRRRSLSGLSKRHSPKKTPIFSSSCSSSSLSSDSSLSSNDSNGVNQQRFLKGSNSRNRNSEMENPIHGAIKHCKQSQHLGKSVAVFPESV